MALRPDQYRQPAVVAPRHLDYRLPRRRRKGEPMGGGQVETEPTAGVLVPYLPRLVIDWLATEPDATYREIDGSVAFVDISGFTKLSERLAQQGKVGAEELAETISSCFTSLLAVAYAEGGGLLKFGGDALLLLYTGPDHELRAARAAVRMRVVLSEVGHLDVLGRRVVLRMSVGVHTGTFHFFLVGRTHRELIITGPAASTTVRMEGTAEAGEILVSDRTAAALPSRLLGSPKGEGILLRRVREAASIDLTGPVEVPAALDLSVAVPVALRRSMLDGVLAPEHRRVCVAFVHFDGTDALIQREGPRETAARIANLVESVQQATEEQQVTFLASDVDRDGGKIILVAGAPAAFGDDDRRMLLALRQLATCDTGLPVRIGINRGDVFVGDIGPAYRRTYTVMGDTVNLAARVMAKATGGQLLATKGVLDRSRTRFDTVALEPFMVKGKSKPVHAFVVGHIAAAQADASERLPLVGRDHELTILLDGIAGARVGHGSIVEIVGEPGLGKSRLVEELRLRTDDAVQIVTGCETYESSTPYYPFHSMVRSLLGLSAERGEGEPGLMVEAIASIAPELVPWAPLVGAVADVEIPDTPETASLEERFRPSRLAEVMLILLERLLPSTTLLLFEDVHWMDEASSALLRELSGIVESVPWVVLTTRRDVQSGHVVSPDAGLSVRLTPLTRDAATRLAHEATASLPVAPHHLAALAERAAGNPLFLKELVAAVTTAEGLDAIPDSVEGLITARIDRLAASDRNLLRRLAVLGRRFPASLVGAVLDEIPATRDAVWGRVAEFVRSDGEGTFAFDHALVRDAAYEGLPFRLRRELHARAGDAITEAAGKHSEDQAELLSLHYLHARRHAEAWRYALAAAERARTIYANAEAEEFYQRAVDASRHLDGLEGATLAQVHERLGEVRERAGQYQRAEASYRQARKFAAGDPVVQARLFSRVATLQGRLQRCSLALAWITRGLRLLEHEEGADAAFERAELLATYAQFCMEEGHAKQALVWCNRAIETAEAGGNLAAEAHARRIIDWALHDLGQLDDDVHSRRALALYEELGDLRGQAKVLSNLAITAYWKGDWNLTIRHLERSIAVIERTGDEVTKAFTTLNLTDILLDQGRGDEALGLLDGAVRALRAAGDRTGTALAKLELGRGALHSGRFEDAGLLFEEARDEFDSLGVQRLAFWASARIAECRLLSGEAQAALTLAEQLVDARDAVPGSNEALPLLHRVRGVALYRLGDDPLGAAAFDKSLEAAQSLGYTYETALTLRVMSHFDASRGEELLAESDALLRALGVADAPGVL
jgi:class 3 adenylate cyclase/tetratricopeptide (TPR) repeat protein